MTVTNAACSTRTSRHTPNTMPPRYLGVSRLITLPHRSSTPFPRFINCTANRAWRGYSTLQEQNAMSTTDYSSVPTPARCYVDFCLIPVGYRGRCWLLLCSHRLDQIGTGSVSVAREVAEVQKLLKASGLSYTMHSAGTTVGKLPHSLIQRSSVA